MDGVKHWQQVDRDDRGCRHLRRSHSGNLLGMVPIQYKKSTCKCWDLRVTKFTFYLQLSLSFTYKQVHLFTYFDVDQWFPTFFRVSSTKNVQEYRQSQHITLCSWSAVIRPLKQISRNIDVPLKRLWVSLV